MDKEKDDSRVIKEFTVKTNKKTLNVSIIDPRTQYTEEELKENWKQFEIEIKLSINERLYEEGCITNVMYTMAKDLILKSS